VGFAGIEGKLKAVETNRIRLKQAVFRLRGFTTHGLLTLVLCPFLLTDNQRFMETQRRDPAESDGLWKGLSHMIDNRLVNNSV
jgi:hypothetical protein